jgi:hypothetical protein
VVCMCTTLLLAHAVTCQLHPWLPSLPAPCPAPAAWQGTHSGGRHGLLPALAHIRQGHRPRQQP